MIYFKNISAVQHVVHGITEKTETPSGAVVFGEQVHKNEAAWVEDSTREQIPRVDALATRVSNVVLGVKVADCVPLLFAEPRMGIEGTIHAGWRGTALDITRKTIEFLKIRPFHLLVGVGPAICPNCFVVGEEVARQFDQSVVRESEMEEGKFHVDLWQANVNQCMEAGVPERNIEVIRRCTLEDPQLYSFRGGDRTERNIAFIQRVA